MYTYEDFKREWESENDSIICRTSGSTGTPSKILLPKKEVAASARRTIDFFGINSGSHLRSCISPEFIGGKMQLIRALEAGCSFSYEHPSNRPLKCYEGGRISLLSVVPSQMIHILDNLDSMHRIDAILVGGSPIPNALKNRIEVSGLNVWETYGMTETASHIALRKVSSYSPGKTETDAFKPLPGITVFLSDSHGLSARHNETGRLGIRINGWKEIVTNDIAEILPDGRFIILGRSDNVIITGGRKIHPEELEGRMSLFLDFPFFLTSEEDEKWGRRLLLVAETDPSRNSLQEILSKCRENLQGYETPKSVKFVTSLPRTANGKLRRN